MMLAEILKTNPVDHLGFNVSLNHLSVTLDKVSFTASKDDATSSPHKLDILFVVEG